MSGENGFFRRITESSILTISLKTFAYHKGKAYKAVNNTFDYFETVHVSLKKAFLYIISFSAEEPKSVTDLCLV